MTFPNSEEAISKCKTRAVSSFQCEWTANLATSSLTTVEDLLAKH